MAANFGLEAAQLRILHGPCARLAFALEAEEALLAVGRQVLTLLEFFDRICAPATLCSRLL